MNDVNNRIFREFTEFFDNVEKNASEISVTMAYEITMKSTISTAIVVLESEGRLEERYWNHLRVQNNILDFLYDMWVGSCHSLASDFSTIMKDLVEYDFIITESIMREGRALLEIQRDARNSACTYRKRGGYTADQSAVLCR